MSNYSGKLDLKDSNNSWTKAYELIDPNSSVLDVGCSNGDFGLALSKLKNCKVDGVEPDLGDYEIAKSKLKIVVNSFIEEALEGVLKEKKYDYIVFLDVIEHLVDPVDVLNRLHKHLNKDGKIIFSIPNMAHISVRLMLLGGDFEYGKTGLLDNTHLHYYTKKEVQRIFNTAGYHIDILNFVEYDYTDEMISEILQRLGFIESNTPAFLKKKDSFAYQYVGSATMTANLNTDSKLKFASPVLPVTKEIAKASAFIDKQSNDIRELQKEIFAVREQIEAKDQLIANLRNDLESSNKRFEIISKAMKPYDKAKRVIKNKLK